MDAQQAALVCPYFLSSVHAVVYQFQFNCGCFGNDCHSERSEESALPYCPADRLLSRAALLNNRFLGAMLLGMSTFSN
jgi:hypothetical protein